MDDKQSAYIDQLKIRDGEDYYKYVWRVDGLIRQGIYHNWEEVVGVVNRQLYNEDFSAYKGESAFRKDVASARKFYEAGVFDSILGDKHLEEIKIQQDNLYKIKKQVSDQRREYNKLLASDGRADNLTEKLLECAERLNRELPLNTPAPDNVYYSGHREAILVLSDWHYGMVTDNIWNKYNTEICRERVEKLIEKTIEYLKLFQIKRLYILTLGDAFHGAIHISCRVASEEDTCDQLMHVSEIMAEMIQKLSKYVENIEFYSCYGNHARTIQNNKESVHTDNMEKILPWWIKQRLQNNHKVTVYESEYKEFTLLSVLGYNICAIHGDLDNIKDVGVTVNTLFTRKFGKSIDYVISGDKHHLEEFEAFDIESIIVRSLCGTDDYANNKRLYSSAGQTLLIMNNEEGRECTRNIKLD